MKLIAVDIQVPEQEIVLWQLRREKELDALDPEQRMEGVKKIINVFLHEKQKQALKSLS